MSTTPLATSIQAVWFAWPRSVDTLVRAIQTHLIASQPPAPQADLDDVRKKLEACEAAALAVGDVRDRLRVSPTLFRLHHDAKSLAVRLIARPPFATADEWWKKDGKHPPHHWGGLGIEACNILKSVRDPIICREMDEAFALLGCPEPEPDRRIGPTMRIRGHNLNFTPQLAEILELALRPNGLPFDEAQTQFEWQQYPDNAIRARVDALKKMLRRETRTTPFTIEVTTRGRRISARIHAKEQAIEKQSTR